MSRVLLDIESVSKQYRVGEIGRGTLKADLERLWARMRGKEDPTIKLGVINDRTKSSVSDYVWALSDISFRTHEGEVLGIIGSNGAGKSTLLKIISRITKPTKGFVKIDGRVSSLLEVGTGFHPLLTGRENIFMNGAILGMSRLEIKSKIDQIIDFSGVARYIDSPVKRYSSGMKVRLGFAVAAFLEPEILIVDEVLAVGDHEFQQKCVGQLNEIGKSGRSVIFVSHNMASIENLCNRVLILSQGQVDFDGDSRQAIDRYVRGQSEADRLNSLNKRSGSGEVIVRKLELKNHNGDLIQTIRSGESFELMITYDLVDKAFRSNNIDFFIELISHTGVIVFRHQCSLVGKTLEWRTLIDKESISLQVNSLYLIPGVYSVNVGITDRGTILDKVSSALIFSVLQGKILNYQMPIKSGVVAIDAVWD